MDESVIKHLEQPGVGTLKLSEAIRIGASKRGQCTGRFFKDGRSCALGAALEGRGIAYAEEDWMVYETVSPLLGITYTLAQEISLKNDTGWSRERIADWLESRGR